MELASSRRLGIRAQVRDGRWVEVAHGTRGSIVRPSHRRAWLASLATPCLLQQLGERNGVESLGLGLEPPKFSLLRTRRLPAYQHDLPGLAEQLVVQRRDFRVNLQVIVHAAEVPPQRELLATLRLRRECPQLGAELLERLIGGERASCSSGFVDEEVVGAALRR